MIPDNGSHNTLNPDGNLLFSSMFSYHFDMLYNYGMKLTGNAELVKDAVQDLFFRIWKNNVDFTQITYPKAYLLKGLRRQIVNMLELKYHQMNKVQVNDDISVEFSPEDYFIQNQYEEEIRNRVVTALNQLSAKQREAVYLRYFEEMEYEEIAEIMNINIQSVKNNVHRGLESMRDFLTVLLIACMAVNQLSSR